MTTTEISWLPLAGFAMEPMRGAFYFRLSDSPPDCWDIVSIMEDDDGELVVTSLEQRRTGSLSDFIFECPRGQLKPVPLPLE